MNVITMNYFLGESGNMTVTRKHIFTRNVLFIYLTWLKRIIYCIFKACNFKLQVLNAYGNYGELKICALQNE